MEPLLARIQQLVAYGQLRISAHGYDELAEDDILATEIVEGLGKAELVEEYPNYPKGPCVLVLQHDGAGMPVHAVWGIPAGQTGPAVLVTAYRPDPRKWEDGFLRRKR